MSKAKYGEYIGSAVPPEALTDIANQSQHSSQLSPDATQMPS